MAKKTVSKHRQGLVEEARVTTLELFFDLVFVFTVTQLTVSLSETLSGESLLQAFLILILVGLILAGSIRVSGQIKDVDLRPS